MNPIFLTIMLLFSYISSLFTLWAWQHFLSFTIVKQNLHIYLIPVILTPPIIVQLLSYISDILFSYFYCFVGSLVGFLIYSFTCCFIFTLVTFWINITNSRIISIFFLIILPFLLSIASIINARIIHIDYITIDSPIVLNNDVTICHLTDMHLGAVYQKGSVDSIVNKIQSLQPDIVVITGDMADGSLDVKVEWLTPFDSLSMPILYITGNHEVKMGKAEILSVVAKTKIKHIGYMTKPFNVRNEVNFIGADYEDIIGERIRQVTIDQSIPTVLLSHIPTLKPDILSEFDIFLNIVGHTHRGQLFPMQPLLHITTRLFYGLYSSSNKKHHVYVGSGVGTNFIPMRSFTFAEIGFITIKGQSGYKSHKE